MTKRSWVVLGLLGLGTTIFLWLFSSVFFGSGLSGLSGGSSFSEVALDQQMLAPAKSISNMMMPEMMPVPPMYGGDDALDQVKRDYELWSSFSVVVEDVGGYVTALKGYVMGAEGRVLSSSMSKSDEYVYAHLTLKVPTGKFDETNGKVVDGVNDVISENVQVSDVTGTSVNLDEQMQRLQEEQLELELQIEETVNAAEKRRLQLQLEQKKTQIEAMQSQIDAQSERIEYGTVNVAVASDEDYFGTSGGDEIKIQEELEQAWQVLWYLLQRVLVVLIWAAVFSILWLPLVLIVVWWKRRKQVKVENSDK